LALLATYQFCGFVEDLLGRSDCGLALFAAGFGDLVELLVQVRLDELQLVLVAGEHLRAGVCVERVRHLDRSVRSCVFLERRC
jgi:hypothetical protein